VSASPAGPPGTGVTASRAGSSSSKSVSIVDYAYNPGSVTVSAGDTVHWTNDGQVPEGHTVTGDGLDSGVLHSGQGFSHTFSSAGTFNYVCTLHPNMKGTVKVLARSGSSGGSGTGGGQAGSGNSGATPPASSGAAGTAGSGSAGSSSDAGGSSGSLPATGLNLLALTIAGLALLDLGLALCVLGPRRAGRRP
jgi:plastocyanin